MIMIMASYIILIEEAMVRFIHRNANESRCVGVYRISRILQIAKITHENFYPWSISLL